MLSKLLHRKSDSLTYIDTHILYEVDNIYKVYAADMQVDEAAINIV